MNEGDFNWSLVPSFLAALEHGSLMGAARATGLSQPTLGRHIAELEQQLNMVLFERTGRGLQATPHALALAEAAKKAERIASAKLIEEMRRNTQGRGEGRIHGKDVDITWKGVRSVGTYNNPLKGKYAGFKLSELPDHYVQWAAHNDKLNGWIKSMFRKELGRRHGRTERFVS